MPKLVFCGVDFDFLPFLRTATVTPIILPLSASMIGPPLLPGFMAASIWMLEKLFFRPVQELTIPLVTFTEALTFFPKG